MAFENSVFVSSIDDVRAAVRWKGAGVKHLLIKSDTAGAFCKAAGLKADALRLIGYDHLQFSEGFGRIDVYYGVEQDCDRAGGVHYKPSRGLIAVKHRDILMAVVPKPNSDCMYAMDYLFPHYDGAFPCPAHEDKPEYFRVLRTDVICAWSRHLKKLRDAYFEGQAKAIEDAKHKSDAFFDFCKVNKAKVSCWVQSEGKILYRAVMGGAMHVLCVDRSDPSYAKVFVTRDCV